VSKSPSPLLGFNNNVQHKGKAFHIQTEDSGVRHPHVITHLFTDGGRIVKTTKTSYAPHLDAANMGSIVRQLMKEQHKAMFIALRDGVLDSAIERVGNTHDHALPQAPVALSEVRVTHARTGVGATAVASAQPVFSNASALPGASRGNAAPQASRTVHPPTLPAGPLAAGRLGAVSERSFPLVKPASIKPQGSLGTAPRSPKRMSEDDQQVREKSLDELILSHLAEEFDGPLSSVRPGPRKR